MDEEEKERKEETVKKMEKIFQVPERVADKVGIVAEGARGGYVLFETRPRWDGSPGPWTKLAVAKINFDKPSRKWKVYWVRASGKWELYGQYKTFNGALKTIKDDKHGCFWG